jgi:hypothetical protein
MLFSFVVNARLRDPKRFLKSVARKLVKKVLPNMEADDPDPIYEDHSGEDYIDARDVLDEPDDSMFVGGLPEAGQFSTDSWQSDQNQIAAEKGPREEDD